MSSIASKASVPTDLTAGAWVADLLMGQPTLRIDKPRLTINSNGVVFGSGGLSHFIGAAEIENDQIKLSILSAKEYLCPTPIADQEEAFMRALGVARSYAVDAQRLLLFDDVGTTVASFDHLPPETPGQSSAAA
ncbi:MAG: META domain-containing protein [Hyphomicrobiaceae bacterium]|nr:META domain-containing protein [Hyphomicrobiaceae bacterium]